MKQTTKDIIEANKMLLKGVTNKEEILMPIVLEYQLTQEFVNTFRNYLTPEMFTKSYKLKLEMIHNNPEYFDESLFKSYYNSNGFANLSVKTFIEYFMDDFDESNLDSITEMIMTSDRDDLSKSIITELFNNATIINNDDIMEALAIQLKDVKAFKTFIIKMSNSRKNLSKEVYNILLDDEKIQILESTELNINELFKILYNEEEYFINKVFSNIEKYNLKESSESSPKLLLDIIEKSSERTILNIIKIFDKMQNWYTQEIGMEILKKTWDNEQIEILKPVLTKAGCGFELLRYLKKFDSNEW